MATACEESESSLIIFIYGTTAEAIKIAPIARRLEQRGIPYQQWVTFQHTDALRTAIQRLGLPEPDRVVADGWRGRPLKTPLQMLGWIFSVGTWTLRNASAARRSLDRPSVVIVHGDTVTTVLGTLIARAMRLPVAHVEAGLRSGDWRNPFPEELDRRIVGRLALIHYAPSVEAAANLGGRPNVVFTHGNTVTDAVRDSEPASQTSTRAAEPYGMVLLHRYEFISNGALARETLRTLSEASPLPMRILVDSYSRDLISTVIQEIASDRFTLMEKVEHGEFITMLKQADFVVTDSGGIQEESAVFGIPTLVHRMATERSEGIGSSALLSRWEMDTVRRFLASFAELRASGGEHAASPSEIIVDDLVRRGYGRIAS